MQKAFPINCSFGVCLTVLTRAAGPCLFAAVCIRSILQFPVTQCRPGYKISGTVIIIMHLSAPIFFPSYFHTVQTELCNSVVGIALVLRKLQQQRLEVSTLSNMSRLLVSCPASRLDVCVWHSRPRYLPQFLFILCHPLDSSKPG